MKTKTRTDWVKIFPPKLLIIEGTLLLPIEEIREIFDMIIFLDVDDDLRLARRVHNMARGIRDEKESLSALSKMLFKYEH